LYKEILLKNNLTVICESLNHLRSVSVGVWIGSGSRNETIQNNGVSHFIEHMVFKGTLRRTAQELACELDSIGGQINAFTGKDCTCFYTNTLDTDIDIAIDVLADMLFNSLFDQEHIEKEKQVILDEISLYEDDPEELVNYLLTESIWSDGPLGFPILGTRESVNNINREILFDYMATHYIPDNCIISVVGNFDEKQLIDLIEEKFGFWKPMNYCRYYLEQPKFKSHFVYKEKDTEQTHLCIGFRGYPMRDSRVCSLMLLNNIVGGSMSSRLFQKIREESGLVYSIYSFANSFRDCGMYTIYAAANPQKVNNVISGICAEIENLLKNGISSTELTRSKNQLKGNFILGLDSTAARMGAIGKSKVITGFVRSPSEVLEMIDNITYDDIMETARWVFDGKNMGIAVLGSTPISEACIDHYL